MLINFTSIYCLLILILSLACTGFGQKTVSDLKPAHAATLAEYLSKHPKYEFLSARSIDDKYLADMSKDFGKKLVPYYQTGDFNRDGLPDFAMILSREGERKENGSGAEEFKYDYPLVIVIFNGQRRGGNFTPAFTKEIEAPLYCLLNAEIVKRKTQLSFGVFESDANSIIFTPAGKGYIVEYPEEP